MSTITIEALIMDVSLSTVAVAPHPPNPAVMFYVQEMLLASSEP